MFTKQHYEKVVKVLVRTRPPTPYDGVANTKLATELNLHWRITQAFADMFEADNPDFNRQKFLKAATS